MDVEFPVTWSSRATPADWTSESVSPHHHQYPVTPQITSILTRNSMASDTLNLACNGTEAGVIENQPEEFPKLVWWWNGRSRVFEFKYSISVLVPDEKFRCRTTRQYPVSYPHPLDSSHETNELLFAFLLSILPGIQLENAISSQFCSYPLDHCDHNRSASWVVTKGSITLLNLSLNLPRFGEVAEHFIYRLDYSYLPITSHTESCSLASTGQRNMCQCALYSQNLSCGQDIRDSQPSCEVTGALRKKYLVFICFSVLLQPDAKY